MKHIVLNHVRKPNHALQKLKSTLDEISKIKAINACFLTDKIFVLTRQFLCWKFTFIILVRYYNL